MKYLIAIFIPFVSFVIIRKPISAYLSFILQVAVILSNNIHSNMYFTLSLMFVISLWAFFEIHEYHMKRFLVKLVKSMNTIENKEVSNTDKV